MLNDKVALITGASRGIGRAIAREMTASGARVAVNYHNSEKEAVSLADEIQEKGGQALLCRANVFNLDEVRGMVDKIIERWNRLDILVNCAGIMLDSSVEETSLEQWQKVMNVNLYGAFICSKAVIPYLKQQKTGRIINISSQAAFTGSTEHAHYSASKAGVLGLTYSLAKELGEFNITVNAVSPGRVMTDMIEGRVEGRRDEWLENTPLGRFGRPEEIAHPVVFLASDKASYITGANLHVNGGLLMG